MKKLSAFVGVAVLTFSLGLCGCMKERTVSVGEVRLVSAGEEHLPLQNWIYSLDKDGLAGDGERKQAKEIAKELETVWLSDDAQIVIEGRTTGLQYYSLYDEQYREVYYRSDQFVLPEKPGSYILCSEVTWGTEKEYEGYQYFFSFYRTES